MRWDCLRRYWRPIPSPPNAPRGPQGAKAVMAMLVSAFPDFDIKIEDLVQDGNKVVVRSTKRLHS
ncbi:ester cyclase [Bradyrhizobium canariense]|uniref:ester cyclase n=1 Tax=Bradyrhizobium canariense TaxID=255045 RepID=UPI00202D9E6E|nr:ester cyclase [Bradyrhizobium canariense]